MVKLIRLGRIRKTVRKTLRRNIFRAFRSLNRAGARTLHGCRRRPSDLGRALTAFSRAIHCHQRLARLVPRFFDSAVVNREAREREDRRRRMAYLEPILNRVYGTETHPVSQFNALSDHPPLPGLRTQHAVDRELAGWDFWMAIGRLALDRHHQRRSRALPSLSQLARLIKIQADFACLACGL